MNQEVYDKELYLIEKFSQDIIDSKYSLKMTITKIKELYKEYDFISNNEDERELLNQIMEEAENLIEDCHSIITKRIVINKKYDLINGMDRVDAFVDSMKHNSQTLSDTGKNIDVDIVDEVNKNFKDLI